MVSVGRMLISLCCLLYTILTCSHIDQIHALFDELPPLWDETTLEEQSISLGYYHILSEIYIGDDKSSYLVEEWLDGPAQMFRMDVLELHPDAQGGADTYGKKKTLLVRGATGERYFFQPFECRNSFDNLTSILNKGLAQKFPSQVAHNTVQAGIGSIWLRAIDLHKKPEFIATFKPAKLVPNSSTTDKDLNKGRKTRSRVLGTFDQFVVDPTPEFPYNTRFYFVADEWQLEGKPNPSALVTMHLVDPATYKTRMTARIIGLEVSSKPNSWTLEKRSLFQLPLGFGCALKSSAASAKYKPPENLCLSTSDQNGDGAHACHLEVTAWLPQHLDHDMDQWKMHTSSLRLVAGQLQERAYLTIEERDFASAREETTPAGVAAGPENKLPTVRAVMRRAKRIWDLGSPQDYLTQSSFYRTKPMYFELDNQLRRCRSFGSAGLNEMPTIELPMSAFTASIASGEQKLLGLSLVDDRTFAQLFQLTDGYELVRDDSSAWLRYRELQQEKQLERLELRDRAGRVAWQGPASLVRKFYAIDWPDDLSPANSSHLSGDQDSDANQPHEALLVELTMILFSETRDRQLARIQLALEPGQQLDNSQLHRELDIGPCLHPAELGDGNTKGREFFTSMNQRFPALNKNSVSFTLVYPIADQQLQMNNYEEQELEAKIYAKFLYLFNNEKLLASSSSQESTPKTINLLQVTDVQVELDTETVRVSAKLNRWPEMFNYIKVPNSRLNSPSSSLRVFTLREPRPSVELCAQSCSYYNCPVFVYDETTNDCELSEWIPSKNSHAESKGTVHQAANRSIVYKAEFLCSAYERKLDSKSDTASAQFLLERMRQLLKAQLGSDDFESPLAIKLELLAGAKLVLVPSSLVVNNDDLVQDEMLLVNPLGSGADENTKESPLELEIGDDQARAESLKVEHLVSMRNRRFMPENSLKDSENFPLQEATHLSLQECQRLCLETDCKSFSHCQFGQQTCMVSQLASENAIRAASKDEVFCLVLARDHLSKFHRVSSEWRSVPSVHSIKRLKLKQKMSLGLDSERDCAGACLGFKDFTCKSFHFCPVTSDVENCFLLGERKSFKLLVGSTYGSNSSNLIRNSSTCNSYERSYVIDYHEHYGKQLAEPKAATDNNYTQRIRLVLGQDAEGCASECSGAWDKANEEKAPRMCSAFQVCLSSPADGTKRPQLICGLLMWSFDKFANSTWKVDEDDQVTLKDASKCTAFTRRDKLVPRAWLRQKSAGQGDGPDSQDQLDKSTGGFWRGFLVVLVSAALGYSFALVYERRLKPN